LAHYLLRKNLARDQNEIRLGVNPLGAWVREADEFTPRRCRGCGLRIKV
jgi:hypothetical protein